MQNFENGVPFLVHLICEIFTQNIIKLSPKNSRKNVKKHNRIVSGTYFHHVSFTSLPFGISSIFRHTQHTLCLNARIHLRTVTRHFLRQMFIQFFFIKLFLIFSQNLNFFEWRISYQNLLDPKDPEVAKGTHF